VVTAETITDEQIRALLDSLETDRARLAKTPEAWTNQIHKAITEAEWALCHDIVVYDRQLLARARCAEIINARSIK